MSASTIRTLHGAMSGSKGAVGVPGGGRSPAGAVVHAPVAELQAVDGGA
jgi:hypothetical protein